MGTTPDRPPRLGRELDRHQERRRRGVPTLTVLVGPPALGEAAWRSWARHNGRACATATAPDAHAIDVTWLSAAASEGTLRRLVAEAMAEPDPEALLRRIDRLAGPERALLIERLAAPLSADLARAIEVVLAAPRDAGELAAELAGALAPSVTALVATFDRLRPETSPCVVLAPPDAEQDGWIDRAIAAAASTLEQRPTMALAVATDRWSSVRPPPSRSRAIAGEGLVHVEDEVCAIARCSGTSSRGSTTTTRSGWSRASAGSRGH